MAASNPMSLAGMNEPTQRTPPLSRSEPGKTNFASGYAKTFRISFCATGHVVTGKLVPPVPGNVGAERHPIEDRTVKGGQVTLSIFCDRSWYRCCCCCCSQSFSRLETLSNQTFADRNRTEHLFARVHSKQAKRRVSGSYGVTGSEQYAYHRVFGSARPVGCTG